MSNLVKFLIVLAPVSALILYFTLLKSNEVATRVSLQRAEIQRSIDQFNEEFANFDNQTFWKKESAQYAKKRELQKQISKLKKQLNQLRREEMETMKSYKSALANASDNLTKTKINTRNLRVP